MTSRTAGRWAPPTARCSATRPVSRARAQLRSASLRGSLRDGFAGLLKLFQAESRFPRRPEDVPATAVEAIAGQVGVAAATWQGYD